MKTGKLGAIFVVGAVVGMTMTLGGCGTPKSPAMTAEDATELGALASLDEKSDIFSARMRILGSLSYGETSATFAYRNPPRYRAFKFAGDAGDKVDAWVRSPNGGDALGWILNDKFEILASNDDADGTTLDAHLELELPGNADPAIRTYYVVYRDYWLSRAKFSVALDGTPAAPDFYSCQMDAECVMVQAGCCPHLGFTSVRAGQEAAYQAALGCADPQMCPMIAIRPELRVPQCNNESKKCELIRPEDIACGGRVAGGNAHDCPDGWACWGTNRMVDGTDICVRRCGGIAGLPCGPGSQCIDDPSDDCDPAAGGADCIGVCEPVKDCRATGCDAGSYCSMCWTAWACIPNGAVC